MDDILRIIRREQEVNKENQKFEAKKKFFNSIQ